MQVIVFPERGTLKDVLPNETVELETEMVVAIMKDVSSALKYLHQLEPPILDRELTSSNVTLNADYGARLMHLHLQGVSHCSSCIAFGKSKLIKTQVLATPGFTPNSALLAVGLVTARDADVCKVTKVALSEPSQSLHPLRRCCINRPVSVDYQSIDQTYSPGLGAICESSHILA